MTMNRISRFPFLVLIVAIAMVGVVSPCWAASAEVPNRTAIIIDGSGSFSARQQEAVASAVSLLEALAAKKLHRWDSDADRIAVISLDALPDVLWEGSARDLKAADRSAWAARFRARSDYAGCTDVTEAFRMAVRHLNEGDVAANKYCIIFSDLISEPPTTSVRRCSPARRPSVPNEGFPWEAMKQISVTALWLPADQALAWRRAATSHGLADTFKVHASDSSKVELKPPPREVKVATEEERKATRDQISASAGLWLRKALRGVAALAGILVAGLVATAVFARLRRRRQGPPRPAPTRIAARPRPMSNQ